MTDLAAETVLTAPEAARRLPGRPHRHTVARWIEHGVLVRGVRVRLRGFKRGGRWVTTAEALEEFMAAVNPTPAAPAATPPSPARARRAAEALERYGF